MASARRLPLSAWLKSRATLWGMPMRLANLGSWAAAAIVLACLALWLGTVFLQYGLVDRPGEFLGHLPPEGLSSL